MIGALDHAVMAVSGDTFLLSSSVGARASAIRASLLSVSGRGNIGVEMGGVGAKWGCTGSQPDRAYFSVAIRGSGHAGPCEIYRTSLNNIRNGGYCLPSGSYRGKIVEVSKD